MSRQLPEPWRDQAPPDLKPHPDAPHIHIRSYRVITPLFGGGVETQQADPLTTVRSSAVRGHLRFWWRATRAGRYGPDEAGLKQMKKAEDRLWGSTENQSLVQVEVQQTSPGIEIRSYRDGVRTRYLGDPTSPLSYAAFPLRRTDDRPMPGGLRFGVSFDLAIMLPGDPELKADVLAALWAWETFGGIGARTRRGFGALHCHRVQGAAEVGPWQPSVHHADDVTRWLNAALLHYVLPGQAPQGVPMLSPTGKLKVGDNAAVHTFADGDPQRRIPAFEPKLLKLFADSGKRDGVSDDLVMPLVVWYYAIDRLKEFRQRRRQSTSRPDPQSRFGRSYWPEPDEIRRRTTGFCGRHNKQLSVTRKFPRAVFGLPMVFQFKDGLGQRDSEGIDPPNTTLQGAKHDRMASRLIVRPLACANERWASVAVVLEGPDLPPDGLKLEGDQTIVPLVTDSLTNAEANFPPLRGKTDVLQAFLDTL